MHTNFKSLLKERQFWGKICDGIHEGFLRCVIRSGLNAQHKLMLQRMRDFISREQNFWILEKLAGIKLYGSITSNLYFYSPLGTIINLLSYHISKCMILLIDSKYCSICHFCVFFFLNSEIQTTKVLYCYKFIRCF